MGVLKKMGLLFAVLMSGCSFTDAGILIEKPQSEQPSLPSSIPEIDQEIAQLQELQEKYRASAQRNANNAMRWQFQNENYLDARKAWDLVAQDKQKIQDIQERIALLEEKKRSLSR